MNLINKVMTVRRILCAGVVAVIMAVIGGCSGGEIPFGDRFDGLLSNGSDEQVLQKALADSGNITIYSFDIGTVGVTLPDQDWYKDFLTYYDSVYGGSVLAVQVEWQDWEDTFITDFASGTAPDLIYLYEKNFPHLVKQAAVMSLNELKSRGVVGFNHPQLAKNSDIIERIYSLGGECYSFSCAMAEADMVFVNEDLFKLYDVKSPSEYYSQGLWTQSTFEMCAKELTRDLNGDSVSDIYGYYGWDPNCFIAAAGGELISLQPDGSLKLGLDDVKTITGLSNFNQIYARQNSGTFVSSWSSGNTAMISWLPSNEYSRLENGTLDFKWSVVPFPLDEHNNDGTRPGKCYGWAVTTSCLNPQGCINYVIAYNTYAVTHPDLTARNYVSMFSEARRQMFVDCTANISVPVYTGVGELDDIQWDMWYALADDRLSVEAVIEQYRPILEQQILLEEQTAKLRS